MMNEIVRARAALNEFLGEPDRNAYKLKRNAIENSIYGVDIDSGAVEIAKLRFWLSLVVDEADIQNIKPLPNLDYKIMQGNSLITSYEDVDFDEIVEEYKPNTQLSLNVWGDKSTNIITELNELKQVFLKTPHSQNKNALRENIEGKIIELLGAKFEEKAQNEGKAKDYYEDKLRSFAQNRENRSFFPWKLYFADAFDNGGFDIVIGNPPYVSTKEITNNEKNLYKFAFGFSDDTYNLFFFKGYDLLNSRGVLTYITPKTFWTTQTKRNLRNLLLSQKINYIFDTANPFESAMVDTCITSISNNILRYNNAAEFRRLWSGHNCNAAVKLLFEQALKVLNNHYIKFLDGSEFINNPEKYELKQTDYINTQNSVIFKPTEINLKINRLYGDKVKKLYDTWWDKIETSKKIAQNKTELEKYRKNLKPGDIALLGCLTEGGQGLATANNGKYIAVRSSTKQAANIRNSRPKKLSEAVKKYKIKELSNIGNAALYLNKMPEVKIAELFDSLKEKYGRDIFGQGYIYRIIEDSEIANVDELTEDEKENGIDTSKKYHVSYDKGDKDGNRWYLETPFAIAWSKDNVRFLKTNSGKKGEGMPVVRNSQFYFREGFC